MTIRCRTRRAFAKSTRRRCGPPLPKPRGRKCRRRRKRRRRKTSPCLEREPLANSTTTKPNGAVLHRTAPFSSLTLTSRNRPAHGSLFDGRQNSALEAPVSSDRSRVLSVSTKCPAYHAKSTHLYPAVNLVFPFVKLLDSRHTAHPFVCRPPRGHPNDPMPRRVSRPESTSKRYKSERRPV